MLYIVNVSGGLTSYEALRRTIERYGREATRTVFADTRIEDPDLYRFLDDIERHLGISIVRLVDGRTVFDIWHDARAITLRGHGAGAAPCSKILKREPIERWLEGVSEPYTLVFGMDWSEQDRMERMRAYYAPTPVWFPLAERPYMDKCHIADALEREGITVPALYREGFEHNNCGGGCVKAGQAHFAHLYRTRPATYARWEAEEERLRRALDKDISILNDRRDARGEDGKIHRRPLTLRAFRERLEAGGAYDATDWGGCGCFAPVAQGRFDEILLEVAPRTKEAPDA